MRVLWAAAELNLAYDHVSLAWDDPALKQPDFQRLNPAGAIPTIVDDGFALSESLAINLYLAKRYGSGHLYPTDPRAEAEIWRWTLWVQGHLEPWVQQDALLADLRAAIAPHAQVAIAAALGNLDRAMARQAWLVGDDFSIGDLNVAAVLSPSRARHLDLAPYPYFSDWLQRCYGRPAAVATRQRFGG